jgi:hypothetical protein
MDTKTEPELRQQIADYRRLRGLTMDKRVLEAIDKIIGEAEEHLRQLEPAKVDR